MTDLNLTISLKKVSIFVLKYAKSPWTRCDTENLQKFKDFKETKVCQPQHS